MNTTARIKQGGKHFEILVDLDKALNFKKGVSKFPDFLESDRIFTDLKKGTAASSADLKEAFGTEDANLIAQKIVKSGDVLLTQDYRDEEREKKIKQVVDFLAKNCFDPQTKRPHTVSKIESALKEAHVNIKNVPVENQIKDIIVELSKVLPIKMEEKKIKMVIPAAYTGQVYGIVNPYKESEEWLNNGDLEVVALIPSGLSFSFFDKLNAVTHGSVLTEEMKN